MLEISTWTLEIQTPLTVKDLPNAFLRRLWLLRPDARSPCCKSQQDVLNNAKKSEEEMKDGFAESHSAINPLDLVTAVYMSANTFLQQEMTVRMMKCQFAVPLILPSIYQEEPSHFLLWPLRGVVCQWKSDFPQERNLACMSMPMVSFVKLGHGGISKSQVLNSLIRSTSNTFLHKGIDGGELPRRLSNGLVEIALYVPAGDTATDIFPVPVAISNLRGDASSHDKNLSFLCHASSAVVVFCGNLKEKEKQLLASCKDKANKLILVYLSETEKNENTVVGFVDQNLEEDLGLPRQAVLQGRALSEEELSNALHDVLKDLLPEQLKLVTLEAAVKVAEEQGFTVDETVVCKKAMETVELVLKDLDQGSVQFKEKQLPLQGALWSQLAEKEKEEKKQTEEGKHIDPQLQKERKDILTQLRSYKMTPSMKIFTNALFTRDKVERTFFLNWMKLKLQMMQSKKQNNPLDLLTNNQEKMDDRQDHFELQNGANDDVEDSDSFCTDSSFEDEETEEQPVNTELQVPEQQFQISQELEPVSPKRIKTQSQQDKNLESKYDPGLEQQFDNTKENKIQGEKSIKNEVYSEEQTSDLEFNGSVSWQGQHVEQALTPNTSDSTSLVQPHMSLDILCERQITSCSQPSETDPSMLSLQHFLREMGLIFELTHVSRSSGNQNVLRLPSLATELLLYGVPLELMDGDASNIPMHWLGCVFAELKRCLPQEQCRTRVLTNLGVHHARNAEVLSALFGVKFPEGRSTKGVYMLVLCIPDDLKKSMECDFLFLIDVEGLCSDGSSLIHDNEMATVAAGLSDILLQNISPHASTEVETNLTVIVNALLRIKEHGSMPICQCLAQDEGINSVLQASQLQRVSDVLQTETGENRRNDHRTESTSCIKWVKGPFYNMSLSEPIDMECSEAVLKLKQNLFGALKKCAAKSEAISLSDLMRRLCAVWDAVTTESFSIGLQDTDIALTFSLLCTELSQWEDIFLEHMESWLMSETKKAFPTKANTVDTVTQNCLLSGLKDKATEEVKTEVDKLRSKVEAYLMKDDSLKMKTFKPVLMCNLDDLQERVTGEIIQRLGVIGENHCSSTQLKIFENLLEKEEKSKLNALIESKSTEVLLQDAELEEEFEGVWSQILSNFDFRPSETDDITARVIHILKENLISRGLQKHLKKTEVIGQNHTSSFGIYDDHFGYRSRLKHMFEDNNKPQKLEAQQLASNIIEKYHQFVSYKCSLPADFSDSYITELLESIELALKEKSMEIRSAFEVDLKVYLCNKACQDFQKLHDRYAKDRELLECISANKSMYLAQFIYHFRKRDQCHRMAQAFTSMVIKPTVMDYIYRPLGMRIAEEIQCKAPQYQSTRAFHQSLLEDLLKEDCFENFLEYLQSYDNFRLKKIQETVVAHLSESTNLNKWRQQRLGEIVGMIAAAVSETAEGTTGVLSDAKPLLERVCLTLEKDGNVDVTRASLDGPLFGMTIEWDYFVTCLMELLAAMRLDLTNQFSQNMDVSQFLRCLPIQPHIFLFKRVKGCNEQCPLCRAPCELEEMGHKVHGALLHRPKGILPNKSCSLSTISCPEIMTKDTYGMSACRALQSLNLDWYMSEDPNIQIPSAYWRYVHYK